ncbi:MAG TPA: DUF4191 domain-containing protein [Jiangellales bacterium]|nr:DUF4191 domain-containing protein [Jiangellales bacterium]
MARKGGEAKSGDAGGTDKKPGRIAQVRQTYQMARRVDPRIGWITLGTIVAVAAVVTLLGLAFGTWWVWLLLGLPMALLAGSVVFGRRAERAAYAQIEGQPGAAAAALGTLRRGWTLTPAVGVNKQQDVVHRVVGRPGVVLIAEGTSPQRVANLLAQEKRRHARVIGEVPLHDMIIGTGEGQVPLRQVSKRVMKLPRALRPAEVTELNFRLRAVGTSSVPLPKGPLPRNVRLPRGGPQMPGR